MTKPALEFEIEITNTLQKALVDKLGLSAEESTIVDVQLAFNNANMLKLLEERANHLK